MNNNIQTAVRAFRRVWSPIAEDICRCVKLDREYDGGEWSSANDALWERLHSEALARVAARFGIAAATLDEAINADFHRQVEHEFSSRERHDECNAERHLYVGDCCDHGSRCQCHVHTPSQLFTDHRAHLIAYLQHRYEQAGYLDGPEPGTRDYARMHGDDEYDPGLDGSGGRISGAGLYSDYE